MKRSILEIYIDILEALADQRSIKITHVMYKANLNSDSLKDKLQFLIKQDLVKESLFSKKGNVYSITQRGLTVLKSFKELRYLLPIVEE